MAPSRSVLAALFAGALVKGSAASGAPSGSPECSGDGRCEQSEEVTLLAHRRELRKQQKLAAEEGSRFKTYAGQAGLYEKFEVDTEHKIGIVSGGKAPKTILEPPDDRETRMMEIINKNFASVTGPGSYLPQDTKMEDTWLICNSIDWANYTKSDLKRGTTIFRSMEKELGIMQNCWEGAPYESDPTCRAIFAALDSITELQAEFPEGPRYANALVSDWGEHVSAFPDSLGPIDQSKMPPSAQVTDPNGMNGFMLCEIVRTILTQSTNQVGSGVCSFVGSLGSLEYHAPAYAIKMAVRLLWTGRPTVYARKPCDAIFDMQPGLVPYESASGWQPKNTPEYVRTLSRACSGNPGDCMAAATSPSQPMGLVFAWYQSLIGDYELSNYGSCDNPRDTKLLYPGASKAYQDAVEGGQGGSSDSDLWGCKRVLDPEGGSCQTIFNLDTCGPTITDEMCAKFITFPISTVAKNAALGVLNEQLATPAAIPQAVKEAGPAAEAFWNLVSGFSNSDDPEQIVKDFPMKWVDGAEWHFPNFNEELLKSACSAGSATLVIEANLLVGYGFNRHRLLPKSQSWRLMPDQAQAAYDEVITSASPAYKEAIANAYPGMDYNAAVAYEVESRVSEAPQQCNHVVSLERCYPDEDQYTIWTWGTRFNISLAGLLGNAYWKTDMGRNPSQTYTNGLICAATIAHNVTMMQE